MTEARKVTLAEYWKLLNDFDWYFDFSDDISVYRAGNQALKELTFMATQSEEHLKLFEGFRAYNFTGEAFGKKERSPKPQKPQEDSK